MRTSSRAASGAGSRSPRRSRASRRSCSWTSRSWASTRSRSRRSRRSSAACVRAGWGYSSPTTTSGSRSTRPTGPTSCSTAASSSRVRPRNWPITRWPGSTTWAKDSPSRGAAMEMKHSLHLSQTQKLIMTPRLQQALKLLQVPTLELQQILKQEVLQNPLLEEVDEVTEQEDIDRSESADEQNNEEAEDPAEEDPIDWAEYLQDGSLDRT